jgi:hypothetical protein
MKKVLNVSGYTKNYFPYFTETEYLRNIQLANCFGDFSSGCYEKRLDESKMTILDISLKSDFFPTNLPIGELFIAENPWYKNNILHIHNRIIVQRSWTLEAYSFIEYRPTSDGLIELTKLGYVGSNDPIFYVAQAIQLLRQHCIGKGRASVLPLPALKYGEPDEVFQIVLQLYGSSAELVEVEEELLSAEVMQYFKEIDETGKSPGYPNPGFVGYELKDDEVYYVAESGALTKASDFMNADKTRFSFSL